MIQKVFYPYVCLLAIFLTACTKPLLESSLEFASSNRDELENVLASYFNDKEKKKAAEFCIVNMPHYFFYKSADLDTIESLLGTISSCNDVWYFKDLSNKDWSGFSYNQLHRFYDSHTITADYLKGNIDDAFYQWKTKKWNQDLSFEDFCELILPYRIGDEPISEWRTLYADYYQHYLDSVYPNGNDVIIAAQFIYDELKRQGFKYNVCSSWPHRRATDLFYHRSGPCRDECDCAIYALRSCGIPCAVDTYFASPETPTSHSWVVIRDNRTGRFIPIGSQMLASRETSINDWRKKGKVYRFTFGYQKDRILKIKSWKNIPSSLRNCYIRDVSSEYFGENCISVEIENPSDGLVFLGVYSPNGWKIIDWSESQSEEQAVFRNLEPGVIYAPLCVDYKDRVRACGYPFEYSRNGGIRYFTPSTKCQSMVLSKKLPFMPWLKEWFSKGLIGGFFELSMDENFTNPVRSEVILDTLTTNFKCFYFPPTRCRYLRFTVPGNDEIVVGQIEAYGDSTLQKRIPCKVISPSGKFLHPENATDGDLTSFFALPLGNRNMVLEFARTDTVKSIGLVPRNNDNFVWPDEQYELFYFKSPSEGWVSLGTVTAKDRYLNMTGPINALYVLRSLSKGGEEEVFYYENNKQIFVHDL
jgi:hypothetical protein